MVRQGVEGTGLAEDESLAVAIRAGDEAAFAEFVRRHRGELQVHCYRMLGSFDESEDIVQETFLRAWKGRAGFQARSTFRAWLYRIATNACLDFLAHHQRRPRAYQGPPLVAPAGQVVPPDDIPWLQPFPDRLLEPVAAADTEPDAVVVSRETIELAFLAAIQYLPPRQRAVLILRDVLGWRAAETAAQLDTSVASVKSALQRARATLKEHLPPRRDDWAPSTDPTAAERALLQRYLDAHVQADLDAMAELLAEDVRVTMPPNPDWLVGRSALLTLTAEVFDPASSWHHGRWRGVATWANRQPAVAHYVERPTAEETMALTGDFRYRAQVLDVLRVERGKVAAITSFEPRVFPAFGLPLAL